MIESDEALRVRIAYVTLPPNATDRDWHVLNRLSGLLLDEYAESLGLKRRTLPGAL